MMANKGRILWITIPTMLISMMIMDRECGYRNFDSDNKNWDIHVDTGLLLFRTVIHGWKGQTTWCLTVGPVPDYIATNDHTKMMAWDSWPTIFPLWITYSTCHLVKWDKKNVTDWHGVRIHRDAIPICLNPADYLCSYIIW